MGTFLGLDLGGTNIKLVVVEVPDEVGAPRVILRESVATRAADGPDAVADRMVHAARRLAAGHAPVAGVGVGVPGLFERDSGRIELFPNLPGPWAGYPLRDRLSDGLGLPVARVALVNDARAFILAESAIGAARGCQTVVGVTLGTGVGGGIIVNGRLHLGANGRAGEVGHQTVDPSGPVCGCGNRGCAEALAQAGAIARAGGRATAEEVFAAAAAGDERCRSAVDRAVAALSIALANLAVVLVPDLIVVGGGVAGAQRMLLDPLEAAVRNRVPLLPADRIRVVPAELGPWAGAIGAALAGSAPRDAVSAPYAT